MRNQILQGDVLEVAKGLPDQSINCIVTSPSYWGLRNYDHPDQLGLEETPEAYVTRLVEIFRELKRVLRDDGNCWLNLGDSYASGKGTCYNPGGGDNSIGKKQKEEGVHPLNRGNVSTLRQSGLKPKDLVGIPWMVAFALRADGWYLRSDIIWEKKNCMPESVTDRPTKSHEYIFLLTKSAQYFYDQDAIREPNKEASVKRDQAGYKAAFVGRHTAPGENRPHSDNHNGFNHPRGRNKRTVWTAPDATDPLLSYLLDKLAADNPEQLQAYLDQYACNATLKSDIWKVATKPFKGAHFAAFPPKLIEPCILAGCPEQVCAECAEPWVRVVEKTGESLPVEERTGRTGHNGQPPQISGNYWEGSTTKSTNVFVPTCACNTPDTRPGIVLDPFMGSGTTAQVAIQNRRDWLGIELNPEYIELTKDRIDGLQVRLL